jgi:hypothetical protein
MSQLWTDTVDMLVNMYPAVQLLLLTAGLLLCLKILGSTNLFRWQPMPAVKDWRPTNSLIWLLILALAGIVFTTALSKRISYNLLLYIAFIYWGTGLGVLAYIMEYGKVKFFKYLMYFIAIFPPFNYFLMLLGFSDVWIDFRRRFSANIPRSTQ